MSYHFFPLTKEKRRFSPIKYYIKHSAKCNLAQWWIIGKKQQQTYTENKYTSQPIISLPHVSVCARVCNMLVWTNSRQFSVYLLILRLIFTSKRDKDLFDSHVVAFIIKQSIITYSFYSRFSVHQSKRKTFPLWKPKSAQPIDS